MEKYNHNPCDMSEFRSHVFDQLPSSSDLPVMHSVVLFMLPTHYSAVRETPTPLTLAGVRSPRGK